MAQQIFFTADTHFGHANIIKHQGRPFDGIEAHDRALVEAWNAVVGPRDLVYHLGDFSFRANAPVRQTRAKLNGQIYLILGNHDALSQEDRQAFQHVADVAEVKAGGRRIWLSHYAHRVWPRSHRGSWHLYGHSHGSLSDDPNALSLDVGVDVAAENLGDYRPFMLDEVNELMAAKNFEPVDHHR
jgi:calcineurin-like phosphoesterase family protein